MTEEGGVRKSPFWLMSFLNTSLLENQHLSLNFKQVITGRLTKFKCFKDNNTKVGLNTLSNRLYVLNDLIPLDWLNMSKDTYKVHCKRLFLNCNSLLPVVLKLKKLY